MNVLIINPPIRLSDKPRHIPHGLAILASIIRGKLDICPAFLDINAHRYSERETEKIIERTDFDVVLVGGLIPTYGSIVRLARFIKKINPAAKIIAGGSAAMSTPEVLLKNSEVDVVCTGEGEITVVGLLSTLKKDLRAGLDGIAGISYKKNGNRAEIVLNQARPLIQNLDEESALPAYDLLPMDIYLSNPIVGIGRDVDFIASRGCPYNCTFCYQPWGQRFRGYSIDFIINALIFLRKEYRIDFVSFQDDEFMSDRARVREFCEKRNRLLPDLLWSCTGRTNIVARDEQISFIIGMPGENEESCQETVDFCIRNKLNLDSLMFATPYPGTEIFDYALKTGRIDPDHIHEFFLKLGDARDFTVNLTDSFSDEELINKREEMIKTARENYDKFITPAEMSAKMRDLFGDLIDKYRLDEKDLEHRMKHGGMGIF